VIVIVLEGFAIMTFEVTLRGGKTIQAELAWEEEKRMSGHATSLGEKALYIFRIQRCRSQPQEMIGRWCSRNLLSCIARLDMRP
jgi:hypothetical protein